MAKRGRKKAYKYSTEPIKVGDWVYPTNVQIGKFEPAYQCEDITEDGKFVADDPSTPDVNEAYEQEAKPEVPQTYVITLETLNKVVNVLGQLDYKSVFQLMEELRALQAVKLNEKSD